jgi:hypothetical protein
MLGVQMDFGIAKLVEDSRQKTGTQPLGSPLFMSREQTDRKGRHLPGHRRVGARAHRVPAHHAIGFRCAADPK